jgi:hypothetical protein
MWQEILVAAIVLIAAFVVGRRFWKSFKEIRTGRPQSCGCGCTSCTAGTPSASECSTPCEAQGTDPSGKASQQK